MKPDKIYNLKFLFPEIARQWHPDKNGDLTPDQVTPGSGKKVWWRCGNGHEWMAVVYYRTAGGGCPYCSGRRLSWDNCLLNLYPKLAKQWHPKKNGDLLPEKVRTRSKKKVWWKCEKGHVWKAAIYSRTLSKDCPYCSNRKVNKENNLLALRPDLAQQWHPTKNGKLTPKKIAPSSGKKVWWKCEKGHEWAAVVSKRNRGTGCPYCSKKKGKPLSETYPELAEQWHPTKNGNLTPNDVSRNYSEKVWWRCKKGHEWIAAVSTRSRVGVGCAYCSGRKASKEYNLLVVNPGVAKQWHPTKNADLKPDQVTPGSGKKVWWRCEHGHDWKATIANRSRSGQGCPYCAGNLPSEEYNLAIINPELAKQWHPTKNGNLKPNQVTPGADKKVWWQCKKGHQWQAHIYTRNKGIGCPICSGKKASDTYNLEKLNPGLAKEWHPTKNGMLKPRDVTPNSSRKVWWICEQGHEWKSLIHLRNKGAGCPKCYALKPKKGVFKKGSFTDYQIVWKKS